MSDIYSFRYKFLEKANQNQAKLDLLQLGCLKPNDAPLQTDESKEDVKTQCKGNSTSIQDPESKQQKSIRESFDKSTHVDDHQRAKRINSIAGSGTRNEATTMIFVKLKMKRVLSLQHLYYLLFIFVLPMCARLPGAEGYSVQERLIETRRNQPVNLTSGTKQQDRVKWYLSPEANSSQYLRIYDSDSGPILRDDGYTGYHFRTDHSIYIARPQPLHSGTYSTVLNRNGHLHKEKMVLKVYDTPEVSSEATESSDAMPDPTASPASNASSGNTYAIVTAVFISFGALLVPAVVITVLCKTGKCNGIWTKASTNERIYHVSYAEVSGVEGRPATTDQTIDVQPQS